LRLQITGSAPNMIFTVMALPSIGFCLWSVLSPTTLMATGNHSEPGRQMAEHEEKVGCKVSGSMIQQCQEAMAI
jgi:hypothetical protein